MNPELRALLRRHGGLVTRAQAAEVAATWAIERACRAGQLDRLLPGVYRERQAPVRLGTRTVYLDVYAEAERVNFRTGRRLGPARSPRDPSYPPAHVVIQFPFPVRHAGTRTGNGNWINSALAAAGSSARGDSGTEHSSAIVDAMRVEQSKESLRAMALAMTGALRGDTD